MPSYKVTYFNFTGKAEPIRQLLVYGNIPFEDERIKQEDWPKIKPTTPLGQLPIIEIDGLKVPQSEAICRYLAKQVGLSGNDDKENLAIDVAIATLNDIDSLVSPLWGEKDPEKKKQKLNEVMDKLHSVYLKKFEEYATKHNGYIAAKRLTWADIRFVNAYEFIRNHNNGKDFLEAYPNLQQVKKNVLSVASINKWIKNRPEVSFPMSYDLKQDL